MKAVAYYRVSTAAQGRSGLGLEAQREAVESLCASRGWEIIAPPFTEVESGKRAERPELSKALHRANVTGATLVVAKLDRLSRNVAFLAAAGQRREVHRGGYAGSQRTDCTYHGSSGPSRAQSYFKTDSGSATGSKGSWAASW